MNETPDYELERLRNIKENEKLMRELGVLHGSSVLGGRRSASTSRGGGGGVNRAASIKKTTSSSSSSSTRTTPNKREQPKRITRSSARLAGHDADSDTLKRKYEQEAEESRLQAEAAKRARHQQLSLSDMTSSNDDDDKDGLNEKQVGLLQDTLVATATAITPLKIESDTDKPWFGIPKEEDQKDNFSKQRKELQQVLDRMVIRSAAKVTPKRIYSMAYHPIEDRDLIFVGDKEGAIGVWDAAAMESLTLPQPNENRVNKKESYDEKEQDRKGLGSNEAETEVEMEAAAAGDDIQMPQGKAWTLQVHGRSPVTCLKLDPVDSQSLFSASYDGTIRKLDLLTTTSDEVWAGDEDVLLSIFDILAPSTHASAFTATPSSGIAERSVWIADHRGGLLHIDLRQRLRNSTTTKRWQVCEKKIGAMSVNPLQPHCIATASLDQHVRLFDVRVMATLPQTLEAPYNYKVVDSDHLQLIQNTAQLAAHQYKKAATSVDFSPRGDQLVAVSYDDIVKIWDLSPSWLSLLSPSLSSVTPTHSEKSNTSIPSSSTLLSTKKRIKQDPESDPIKSPIIKKTQLLTKWFSASPIQKQDPIQQDFTTVIEPSSSLRPSDLLASPVRIPHNNQTGKWLTLFRARWNSNPDLEPHFTMGSMTRRAEIYASDGSLLRSLWNENMVTAVPAVTCMHPRFPGRLATGNASGKCTFWAPPL